jgi:ribokinase
VSRLAAGEPKAIVVFGSINQDIRLAADRIARPGETVGRARLTTHWGGKGANQAVAAARLGGRVALVSAVGSDEAGEEAVAVLDAEGVDCTHVRRVHGSPTGRAVVIVAASGENAITVAPGATDAVTTQGLPDLLGSVSPGILLTCFELPPAVVREAAWIAAEAGWEVILNPAPAAGPLPGDWPRGLVFTPNAHELAALTGIDDEAQAAQALAAGTGATVVVTLGERGALVAGPGGIMARVPAPRDMAVLDTTGAGDAFNGTLAWCLSRGTELTEATGIAVRAASASTRREGAREGMLTAAQLAALPPAARPASRLSERTAS